MALYQKLGRDSSARKALFRSLVTALIDKERIETTEGKASEVQAIAEEFITLAKVDNLHNRRQAMAFIYDESVVKKLFENVAPRFAERKGGYTRIMKTGYRKGDAAPMAILELV
ncbi:MAG TPA: 50S ribosomal protein L17 [Symbiobacteriaceae bacterium]|nr:50S ribosomal protein L17 [Symbiobacteriaceae bacterium]